MQRRYSLLDKICLGADQVLRALSSNSQSTGAAYPAADMLNNPLDDDTRKLSARLMRVNHAGEICAQALYHGQAHASRNKMTQEKLQHAALEEGNHLRWCQQRLTELNSHPSYLNPLWYAGSFSIGFAAGMIGDGWSLGFLAETERQVIKHLESHTQIIAEKDPRTNAILEQMAKDEAEHRDAAIELGAEELPAPIKKIMSHTAKIMVKTAYWV